MCTLKQTQHNCYVATSKVNKAAGYGLFARRELKRGEIVTVICECNPVTKREADELVEEDLGSHLMDFYTHIIDGRHCSPHSGCHLGIFVNDFNPLPRATAVNIRLEWFWDKQMGKYTWVLRTLKPVAAGTELLRAYGKDFWTLQRQEMQALLELADTASEHSDCDFSPPSHTSIHDMCLPRNVPFRSTPRRAPPPPLLANRAAQWNGDRLPLLAEICNAMQ